MEFFNIDRLESMQGGNSGANIIWELMIQTD